MAHSDGHLHSPSSGFTVIELMIVLVVIGILSAIAIPNYLGIKKRAARNEAKTMLPALAMALENYHAENGSYGPNGNYTYTLNTTGAVTSTFNHPGNLADSANLGNNLLYNYNIAIGTNIFTVSATPMRGHIAGDSLVPFLNQNGVKGPTGFGW